MKTTRMTKPLPKQISPEEAGDRIRRAREAAGLTQGQAAELLGMSQPRLSEMERGKKVTTWTRLVAIVVKLGLDPKIVVPEFFAPPPKKNRKP